jgi:two-component system C4-dicarboxylate transport sensor histidine kinase DctB
MRDRFRRWLEALDPAVREADHRLGAWAGLGIAALVLVLVASRAPGVREFFRLPAAVVLWCLLPVLIIGPAANVYDRWRGFSATGYGLAVLATSALLQLSSSALAVFAEAPGAFLMAVFPILVASYHGFVFRATPQEPFVALAHGAGMLAAVALRPDAGTLALFAIVAPAGLSGCLLLGSLARRNAGERTRLDAHRSAIQAQVLEQRSAELHQLSAALGEILETNHDAGNALSTSLINANFVVELAKKLPPGAKEADDLQQVAHTLQRSLERLKRLVDETRQVGQERRGLLERSFEPVAIVRTARAAIARVADRYPHVGLTCTTAGAEEEIAAMVRGGEESLARILENLLMNACQGDGRTGAAAVAVLVRANADAGAVAIHVADDGPGFSEAQLACPIAAFETTKPTGTGLGLYTADRLARASAGSLVRENRPNVGAIVTVYLKSESR